jgi:hypothetical protein
LDVYLILMMMVVVVVMAMMDFVQVIVLVL